MTPLEEMRSDYPQYNDLSDDDLLKGLHKKDYSDMKFEEFNNKMRTDRALTQFTDEPEDGALKEGALFIGKQFVGAGEVAASLFGGMLSFINPIPGLAGLAKTITSGPEEGTKTIRYFQEALDPFLAYQPKTEAGKRGIAPVHKAFELLHQAAEVSQEKTEEFLNPVIGEELGIAAGATIGSLIELTPIFLGELFKAGRSKLKRGEKLTPQEELAVETGLEEIGDKLSKRKNPKDAQGVVETKADAVERQKLELKGEKIKPPKKADPTTGELFPVERKQPEGKLRTEVPQEEGFEMSNEIARRRNEKAQLTIDEGIKPQEELSITDLKRKRLNRLKSIERAERGGIAMDHLTKKKGKLTANDESGRQSLNRINERKAEIADIEAQIKSIEKPILKRTKKTGFNPETDSLSDLVRKEGGLKEEAMTGDAARLGRKEVGGFNLLNKKKGKSFDRLLERAKEEGFVESDATITDFIDLLEKDLVAKKTGTSARAWSVMKQDFFDVAEFENAMKGRLDGFVAEEKLQVEGGFIGRRNAPERESHPISNPEIEGRIQDAKKGIESHRVSKQFQDRLSKIWHRATRTFEDLPNTPQFANIHDALRQRKHIKIRAESVTDKYMRAITKGMSRADGDLFLKKILFDDLVETARRQKAAGDAVKLPFGLDEVSIVKHKGEIDALVGSRPNISKATQFRKDIYQNIKGRMIKAYGDLGFDVTSRFTREDYFRHQVIEHAEFMGIRGAKDVKPPMWRSFMKRRRGSEKDINLNYIQAEFEVMAQMEHDIRFAQNLLRIKKDPTAGDIMPSLRKEMAVQKHKTLGSLGKRLKEQDPVLFKNDIAIVERLKKINKEKTELFKEKVLDRDALSELQREQHALVEQINDHITARQDLLLKDELNPVTLKPKNYTAVPVKDIMYRAETIPSQIAQGLLDDIVNSAQITKGDISKVWVNRGKEVWVLPDEVAKTLANERAMVKDNLVSEGIRGATSFWKKWQLFSPRRLFNYLKNNTVGDVSAIIGIEPGVFKGGYFRRSWKEITNTYKGKKPSKRLEDFLERGGADVSITPEEVARTGTLPRIKAFDERTTVQRMGLGNIGRAWFNKSIDFNTFLESHRRFAAYNYYLDQWNAGKKIYGGSKREIIDALKSNEQRAFKLSNDLLVAYDEITVLGQDLRATLAPFWSFQEGNMKRFYNASRNAIIDGKTAKGITTKLLGPTAQMSTSAMRRLAGLYIRLSALWAATNVWNLSMFPEEERSLSRIARARPHIILGKTDDGRIVWQSTPDSFGEALKWVGLDAFPEYVSAYLEGRMDLKEIGEDMAKGVGNTAMGSASPIFKVPAEIVGGKALYPDVFNPRTIQDQWENFFKGWALEKEYREIIGRPTRGFGEGLVSIFIKRTDVNAGSYWDIVELKSKYMKEELGKPVINIKRSPKGWALYNWRLAKKFRDSEKEKKFLDQYIELSREELIKRGDKEGLEGDAFNKRIGRAITGSWLAMHPLSGLNDQRERPLFLSSLTPSQQEKFQRALTFWGEMLTPEGSNLKPQTTFSGAP